MFLAHCDVCTSIVACTHINFWKNLKKDGVYRYKDSKLTTTTTAPTGDKNAKRRATDQARRDAEKAKKATGPISPTIKRSDLLISNPDLA